MAHNPLFKWTVSEDLYVMNRREGPNETLATISKTRNDNGKFRVYFWTPECENSKPHKFWADDIDSGQKIVEKVFEHIPPTY